MDDTYISLGTGHAGYISGTSRRKAKNPIGFEVPKRKNKPVSRLPRRASASPTPRARVTKSTTKRKHTTRNT